MIDTGMIFQFDSTTGLGLVMLSDGEQKTFCSSDWVDNTNEPAVGLKIYYENNHQSVKVRVATKEDETIKSEKEENTKEDESITPQFNSVDEYIKYYTDMGFKLVKDIGDSELRTASLRIYTVAEYGEAVITQEGSKISVTQVLNGKTISRT